ncbi:MAG: NAD-dependent malic enzyme [Chlamydiae bacterium]|nr:NAD-dependent malic enzyme [Chlamydiota bacterium]
MNYRPEKDAQGNLYYKVNLSDYALISNPLLNKGMGFSEEERSSFRLHGLIPPHVSTIQEQAARSYTAFQSKTTPLDKYIYLQDLQNSNETLFYYLITHNLEEMLPIIYTPTVGEGCVRFSHIYRRPRGLFLSYPQKNRIEEILANPRFDYVEAIVVSDGERVLGLGDQGAGGIGIPVGKLSLYTACAGIHPATTLPILLDTGTDNKELLRDPNYIGWRHERIRDKEYDDFVDLFIQAVKRRFPWVLLQWEDFAKQNAEPLLQRYRQTMCTFNDDIQGTAAVTVGTLLAAVRVSQIPLRNQKIAILGGGSAGCGIANLIVQAMLTEGLSEQEALDRFYLVDYQGLFTEETSDLMAFQKCFCKKKSSLTSWTCKNQGQYTLYDVVKNVHPTLLVGVSGQKGLFTEEIVKEMASHVERPIFFPLSNPTSRSEATPEDLLTWTKGKAILGTGSPFPPVVKEGKSFRVDQTNNAYIFPGMALGLIAIQAKCVPDALLLAAAKALAHCSPAKLDPTKNLLPPLTEIGEISFQIALAVAKEAMALGLAAPCSDSLLEQKIREKVWKPIYVPYRK